MFSLLDRYIMGNFLVALGLAIFVLAGMFWLGQSVVLIDQIVLRGESALTFVSLSTKLIPKILINVTPVAALAGALFAMNTMATHAELVVMSATGRRPLRAVKPIAIVGLILSLMLLIISLYIAPRASYELRQSLREIQSNFSNNVIQSGRFVFPIDKVTVFAGNSLLSGEMLNLFIEDRREDNIVRTYFADRGVYIRDNDAAKIALINGEFHEHNLTSDAVSRAHFERTEVTIDVPETAQSRILPWRNEKNLPELIQGFKNPDDRARYLAEIVDRIFYPLLGFILPVIAVIIFQRAPYSRHGYGGITARAAIIGLSLTALQLAAPTVIAGNIAMVWITFIPLIALLIVYFSTRMGGY